MSHYRPGAHTGLGTNEVWYYKYITTLFSCFLVLKNAVKDPILFVRWLAFPLAVGH